MSLKLNFFIFLFVLFGFNANSQTKTKASYDYLLYLPKDYAKGTKKYPLAIYLHGGSQKGNDLNKLKIYGLPYLVEKGQDFDFIIASPQCPDNKYWSTENWFESLYAELSSKYRIDTDRIYLTGISMGGYGTFITALDFPDKFAAIVPFCGGVNDSDLARICNLSKIPVWTFHGTADDKIPFSETERIEKSLESCETNKNFKFTRLENEGHEIQYLYETKPEIYKWMLKQKKSNKVKP